MANKAKTAEKPAVAESKVLVTQSDTFESRNEVKITGSVVHLYRVEDRNIVVLTIATSTGGKQSDFPKVVFYGKEALAIQDALDLESGKRPQVSIVGSIQTSKQGEGATAVYRQNVIGSSLALAPTSLESALNIEVGNKTIADENQVILVGRIVHLYHFDSKKTGSPLGTVLTLKTLGNRFNFPKITLFRDQSKIAQEMDVGDHVAVIGTIQTSRTVKDGAKTVYYETIIGSDIDWYKS